MTPDALLAAIVNSSADAIVSFSAVDGQIQSWNPGAERLFGYTAQEAIGQGADLLVAPLGSIPAGEGPRGVFDRALAGEVVHKETVRVAKDGTHVDVTITARRIVGPDGAVLGVSATMRDIREQKRAAAAEKTRASEFAALAENIPTLCWMAYPDGHIYWYNRRWYEFTGLPSESLSGWGWESVHDPEVLPQVSLAWRRSLATGEPFEMTFPLRRHDGVFRSFLTRIVPVRDDQGRIVRWFGANVDITDQQEQEQRLQLMVHELNHRVKNTLAMVQSLAAQTARDAQTPAEAYTRLESRLLSLSAAHNILTEESWSGADFTELAHRTLAPFMTGGRLTIEGPQVRIAPEPGISLAMLLHELGTNAVKHGSLSGDHGVAALTWQATSEELTAEWRETGGPVVHEPSRKGFGTRLIQRSLAREGGAVTLEFASIGLVCTMRLPLSPLD